MIFTIQLADEAIEIHSIYDKVYDWCRAYLIPSDASPENKMIIEITQEDIENEDRRTQDLGRARNPESFMVYHPAHLELSAVYRRICEELPLRSVFMMHGSAISTDGHGYLFTAPSGTGKTTRTLLWKKAYPQSVIVNGDKPLIRVKEEGIYVYGTPWAGKEGYQSNTSSQLQTVFLLERADEGEADSIQKLSPYEAFPFVYRQIYLPENPSAKVETLNLMETFLKRVNVYKLRCAPTEAAMKMAMTESGKLRT